MPRPKKDKNLLRKRITCYLSQDTIRYLRGQKTMSQGAMIDLAVKEMMCKNHDIINKTPFN